MLLIRMIVRSLSALAFFFLASCSAMREVSRGSAAEGKANSESSAEKGTAQGKSRGNMFQWKDSDVQRGDDGSITGGRRSSYDQKRQASLGRKGSQANYMDKDYVAKRWQGNKDFSKGSYSTKSYAESGKRSSATGERSRFSKKRASADGNTFATKAFSASSAREGGRNAITTPTSQFHGKKSGMLLPIFSKDQDFRNLSVDQTRNWLGRDQ